MIGENSDIQNKVWVEIEQLKSINSKLDDLLISIDQLKEDSIRINERIKIILEE
jgi:hypothetical protein